MMQTVSHGQTNNASEPLPAEQRITVRKQGHRDFAMSGLHLKLFGEVQARRGTVTLLDLPGRKATALLSYLALSSGRSESREKLADLLWGDHFEEQAKQNLRQCLTRLRKALGTPPVLIGAPGRLSLDETGVQTDIQQFESLVATDDAASLEKAASLYDGELMEGLDIANAEFQDWIASQRVRFADMHQGVLERLAALRQTKGDYDGAIMCWRKSLLTDPLRESAYRALMRLYVEIGRRTAALKEYQACEETLRRDLGTEPDVETISLYREIVAGEKRPTSAIPAITPSHDEPAIAVLPFENLGGDDDQDYFADGVSEDITTELSRFQSLLVIARNSSFQYKGMARDVRMIGRELGADYILEGSVRRDTNRLRVTAQLVDAVTAEHIWAERYDRDIAGLFDLQEEITGTIVGSIAPEIALAEVKRAARDRSGDMRAYDVAMLAMTLLREARSTVDKDLYQRALDEAEQATQLDPQCSEAWATLAFGYAVRAFARLSDKPEEDVKRAHDGAERLRQLDGRDHRAFLWLGWSKQIKRHYDAALADLRRARELNPNCTLTLSILGATEAVGGLPDEARNHIRLAIRRSPRDPMLAFMYAVLAFADFATEDFKGGVHWARQAIQVHPAAPANHLILAANLVGTGALGEAHEALDVQRRISPELLDHHLETATCPFRSADDADRYVSALHRAIGVNAPLSIVEG